MMVDLSDRILWPDSKFITRIRIFFLIFDHNLTSIFWPLMTLNPLFYAHIWNQRKNAIFWYAFNEHLVGVCDFTSILTTIWPFFIFLTSNDLKPVMLHTYLKLAWKMQSFDMHNMYNYCIRTLSIVLAIFEL